MTKARDLANASTALSAVDATELGYLDGVTSAVQTQLNSKLASSTAATTYVANSLADAKGDLFVASADNTVTRLPVGSTGDTIVADSSTATGLRYQGNFAAGKNKIINGDFGIWQRGTSFSPPALDSFVADRFRTYFEGSGTTRAVTRQTFTPGTAPVAGYEGQYFLRYAQTVGPSAGIGNNLLMQNIEDVRTFAGQTVTFSFWAKTAATTVLPEVYAYQYFGTGGSPSGNVYVAFATNVSVGTSWTRYSYTATIPSISGKTIGTNNDGYISFRTQHPLGSGNTFTIDYWGWQVEAGSVATAFQTATGTIQGELAACQRYCYVLRGNATATSTIGSGYWNTTANAVVVFQPKVSMRTTPSLIYSALSDITALQTGVSWNAVTAIAIAGETNSDFAQIQFTSSGGTQGNTTNVRITNSTSAYIGLTAEL